MMRVLIVSCLLGLGSLGACSDPRNDVTKFDEAKLERLAAAGDAKAVAERARRASAKDAEKAQADAKAAEEKKAADAKAEAEGKAAFEAALAKGDEDAMSDLASNGNHRALYHRSQIRMKADDQGLKRLGLDDVEWAAELGNSDALLWVGLRRNQGAEGYPLNPSSGLNMVERAAGMGNVDAMYAAGQIYEGDQHLHDVEKAKAWYKKAAEAGSDAAKSRLKELGEEEAELPKPE